MPIISVIFVVETKKLGRTGGIPVIASWLRTSICSGFLVAAIPRSNPKPLMLLALADLYVLKSAKEQRRRRGGRRRWCCDLRAEDGSLVAILPISARSSRLIIRIFSQSSVYLKKTKKKINRISTSERDLRRRESM
jgi:hypothetical protein